MIKTIMQINMCMVSNKCGIYFKHNQSFEVLTLNKYVYMAYSVTDWERVRMLSERDSVKAVGNYLFNLGLDFIDQRIDISNYKIC